MSQLKNVLFFFSFLLSATCFAGTEYYGQVGTIWNEHGENSPNTVEFYLVSSTGGVVYSAKCETGTTHKSRFTINTSTTQGKNALASLLTAKALGKSIGVLAQDTCKATPWADDAVWNVVLY